MLLATHASFHSKVVLRGNSFRPWYTHGEVLLRKPQLRKYTIIAMCICLVVLLQNVRFGKLLQTEIPNELCYSTWILNLLTQTTEGKGPDTTSTDESCCVVASRHKNKSWAWTHCKDYWQQACMFCAWEKMRENNSPNQQVAVACIRHSIRGTKRARAVLAYHFHTNLTHHRCIW